MTRVTYHVQHLNGYTDGRPSWCKVSVARTKESAEEKAREFRKVHVKSKFRVRKITRK